MLERLQNIIRLAIKTKILKISNTSTKRIGTLIADDTGIAPYLSGPQLVEFYNECGSDDEYGQGFPSRWAYSTEKIKEANGTPNLKLILEEFLDPRRYSGDVEVMFNIAEQINNLIKYDGFELVSHGGIYKVVDLTGVAVNPIALNEINHDFLVEQITKCQSKISAGDFNGAITNSRTLTETVLIHIIETVEGISLKNDGQILGLWNRAKKAIKLNISKDDVPEYVFQIIAGLDTTINGLAAVSNNAGDRHANKFKTKKHHAKLAVNASMTLCDFLIDVFNERNRQIK